ncbi:hypothetical protein, partial [Pelagicoccus sp. SDUM812003]|uniref:hypothetical protein n=1 Tax=Pelagicoccus sp. SDUM812003 TaxID=3041267 RepID=UPI00280D4C19
KIGTAMKLLYFALFAFSCFVHANEYSTNLFTIEVPDSFDVYPVKDYRLLGSPKDDPLADLPFIMIDFSNDGKLAKEFESKKNELLEKQNFQAVDRNGSPIQDSEVKDDEYYYGYKSTSENSVITSHHSFMIHKEDLFFFILYSSHGDREETYKLAHSLFSDIINTNQKLKTANQSAHTTPASAPR